MKPVFQTDVSRTTGNCYQACIASVLELKLEDVPHFIKLYGNDYFGQVQKWLSGLGLMMLRTTFEQKVDDGTIVRSFCSLPEETICIAFGKSKMHGDEITHAVVGQIIRGLQFELLHDPNPNTNGINGNPFGLDFIVSKSPLQILKLNI